MSERGWWPSSWWNWFCTCNCFELVLACQFDLLDNHILVPKVDQLFETANLFCGGLSFKAPKFKAFFLTVYRRPIVLRPEWNTHLCFRAGSFFQPLLQLSTLVRLLKSNLRQLGRIHNSYLNWTSHLFFIFHSSRAGSNNAFQGQLFAVICSPCLEQISEKYALRIFSHSR